MLFAKLVKIIFQEMFGEFSDNVRKILKSTENLRRIILRKVRKKQFFEKFSANNSVNFRNTFLFAIKYLLLQNSDVCRVSKVYSLICSRDKVLKVAFLRRRWLHCLKGNVSGST